MALSGGQPTGWAARNKLPNIEIRHEVNFQAVRHSPAPNNTKGQKPCRSSVSLLSGLTVLHATS
jgi:hypothetical protein